MKNHFIDTVISGTSTGAALELQNVTIVPHDPDKDLMLKLIISALVGLLSPLIKEIAVKIRNTNKKRREKKLFNK